MLDEKAFDTGVVTINYGEGPISGPPLVLLHGAGGRWLSFLTVLPELVGLFHVYALDYRGHGLSGRVGGAYRIPDYVQDAVAFLRARASEPALLWGQSLGANVAIDVAAQIPELLQAVVLEEPAIEMEELGPSEALIRGMRALTGLGRTAGELFDDLAGVTIPVPGRGEPLRLGELRGEEYLRLMAECLSLLDPEVLDCILELRLAEGYDVEALLRQVTCPALFLQGDPALGGLEDEVAERATELLPQGRRVKVPGAGHNVHVTRPEAALQSAGAFLESISGHAGPHPNPPPRGMRGKRPIRSRRTR